MTFRTSKIAIAGNKPHWREVALAGHKCPTNHTPQAQRPPTSVCDATRNARWHTDERGLDTDL